MKENSTSGTINEKYVILQKLGEGAYSTVYKVTNKETNEIYAIKVIHRYNKNEMEINKELKSLNSPYIVKFYELSQGEIVLPDEAEADFKPYFVFELSDKGELKNYINIGGNGFDEKHCKMIFYEILKAFQIIHNKYICHRDIKAENILLNTDKYEIKICDFGFSSETYDMLDGYFGTKQYMAPEIIMDKRYDGIKADIFSLGVLLFYIRTASFLFEQAKLSNGVNPKTAYDYIKEKNGKVWEMIKINPLDELSGDFKELIFRMLAFNPKERPSVDEILKDEWMKEISNLPDDERQKLKEDLIKEFKKREEIMESQNN